MLDYLPLFADLVLACAAIGATVYCIRLGRRLSRFSSIDKGLGGAIAVLSRQVDEMTTALASAKTGSDDAEARLEALLGDARRVSDRLEMLVAGCHDLPAEPAVDGPTAGPSPTLTAEAETDPSLAHFTPATVPQEDVQPLFRHRMPGAR